MTCLAAWEVADATSPDAAERVEVAPDLSCQFNSTLDRYYEYEGETHSAADAAPATADEAAEAAEAPEEVAPAPAPASESVSPSPEDEAEPETAAEGLESSPEGVVALAVEVAAGASPTAVFGVGTAACPQMVSPAETAASTSSP